MKFKLLVSIVLLLYCFTAIFFPGPVLAQTDPPSALQEILQNAANKFGTPYCVLEAVALVEGGYMWNYSNSEIEQYSAPGAEDPTNCTANSAGASGPMQFTNRPDSGYQWNAYKNAGGRINPKICNIYDSVYAASKKLANDGGGIAGSWSTENMRRAIAGYYGRCHDCSTTPNKPDCKRLGMSYCDFVVDWCGGNIERADIPSTGTEVDCIADGLADYISVVFDALGTKGSGNVKFLTPAFNMTNEKFAGFAQSLESSLGQKGYSLSDFAYTAGNAYNTSWGSITDFVNIAKGTPAGSNPIVLTETGWYPHETNNRTKAINTLQSELAVADIAGGLVFNVFGTNDMFDAQALYDGTDSGELQGLCSGINCGDQKIGANSAVYFYNKPVFYTKSTEFNMSYTLEIANAGDVNGSVKRGIEDSSGIPIIRIGVGDDGGGFEDPEDLVNFINTIKGYTSKTVYIIIGPNEPLTERWATPDCFYGDKEGITINDSGHVCTDFLEKRDSDSESSVNIPWPSTSPLPGAPPDNEFREEQTILGTVDLDYIKFPNFKRFQQSMVGSLNKTLPKFYWNEVSLPGNIKMYFKHFVQGQNEEGSFNDPDRQTKCEETPQAEVTVPDYLWGRLTGAIRGLCTHLGFCEPLDKYQFKLKPENYSCLIGSCMPGAEVDGKKLSADTNTGEIGYSVDGYVDKKESYEHKKDDPRVPAYKKITKSKTHREIKLLSRSHLSGVGDTVENATKLFFPYLSEDIIARADPKDEAEAVMTGFKYNVVMSPIEYGEHPSSWYRLGKLRNYYCMHLCTLYPEQEDISEIDPLCPSCNPDDYVGKEGGEPKPEPDDVHKYCVWDKWIGACDYYDPNYCENERPGDPTCDECKLCESCLCLPGSLPPPGKFFCDDPSNPNCDASCIGRCYWEYYEKNPEGGYGQCHYKHNHVCKHGPGCADICNAGCCPGD